MDTQPQTNGTDVPKVTESDNTNFGRLVKLMSDWQKIHPDSNMGIRSITARVPYDVQMARAKAKRHRDMCQKRAKAARKRNRR